LDKPQVEDLLLVQFINQIGNLTPQIEDLTSPFRLYRYSRTYTTLINTTLVTVSLLLGITILIGI